MHGADRGCIMKWLKLVLPLAVLTATVSLILKRLV